MRTTVLVLILTVVVIPLVSFYYGTPLNHLQSDILSTMGLSVGIVIAYCFIVGSFPEIIHRWISSGASFRYIMSGT